MSVMRSIVVYKIGAAAALVLLSGATAYGQEADEEPADESEVVDEIIVSGSKPGGRKRVDEDYEDPVRARLLKDFHEMQADKEEYEWRKSAATDSPSRIKWGYDPRDDYQMRSNIDLDDQNWGKTKPATLFRLEF